MNCNKCGQLTTVLYDSPRGQGGVCAMCKEEEEHEIMMEEAYAEEQAAEDVEDDVEDEELGLPPEVKCVVTIGVLQDNQPFIRIDGSAPDLFTAEGLIDYAKRYIERVWELRTMQSELQAKQAEEEAAGE